MILLVEALAFTTFKYRASFQDDAKAHLRAAEEQRTERQAEGQRDGVCGGWGWIDTSLEPCAAAAPRCQRRRREWGGQDKGQQAKQPRVPVTLGWQQEHPPSCDSCAAPTHASRCR